MKLLLALLCQNADQNEDETLNAHGIFFELRTSELPVTPRPLALLCQFQAERRHRGERVAIEVTLREPRGEIIFTRETEVYVSEESWTSVVPVLVAIGCEFPRAGEYVFEIGVDGEPAGQVSLEVSRS